MQLKQAAFYPPTLKFSGTPLNAGKTFESSKAALLDHEQKPRKMADHPPDLRRCRVSLLLNPAV